jgi:hypothetical protein
LQAVTRKEVDSKQSPQKGEEIHASLREGPSSHPRKDQTAKPIGGYTKTLSLYLYKDKH